MHKAPAGISVFIETGEVPGDKRLFEILFYTGCFL